MKEVGARVARMRDRGRATPEQQCGERRPHARQTRFPGSLIHGEVRLDQGGSEQRCLVANRFRDPPPGELCRDRFNRESARDLTRSVSAHPVCNDEESGFRQGQRGILVVLANQTCIGPERARAAQFSGRPPATSHALALY